MIARLISLSFAASIWRRGHLLIFIIALAALAPLGYVYGLRDGRATQAELQQGEVELESRVMALIVERYPQATIRDFSGFPAELLQVARETDIDFRLLLAIAEKESAFRPDAVGTSGEIGLMQIQPGTAELVVNTLGLDYTPPTSEKKGAYLSLGSLADPKFNIRVGAVYLRWQIKRYGFGAAALRAYNRHPDRALEHRPADRYAEDVGLRYLALAHTFRRVDDIKAMISPGQGRRAPTAG
jgi:soluble lytic murein transglycosylase-like protein